MNDTDNVQQLGHGPDGSLLAFLGDNDKGHAARLVLPGEGQYIPLRCEQLSGRAGDVIHAAYWSEHTCRFYFVAKGGLLTVPEAPVLALERDSLD